MGLRIEHAKHSCGEQQLSSVQYRAVLAASKGLPPELAASKTTVCLHPSPAACISVACCPEAPSSSAAGWQAQPRSYKVLQTSLSFKTAFGARFQFFHQKTTLLGRISILSYVVMK